MSIPADTLPHLLAQRNWRTIVERMRELTPSEAADFVMSAPFEQQRVLFARLPIDLAISLIPHFPYYHAYVLLHSSPAHEMRAIVDGMDPAARDHFLDELPEEAWQHLMDELAEAQKFPAPIVTPVVEIATQPAPAETAEAEAEAEGPIVEARGVSKSFRQPEGREIQVIAPTNLSLEAGGFSRLLGASGSGQSTPFGFSSG